MAEEEKTELPEITEEKIEKAALPQSKRVEAGGRCDDPWYRHVPNLSWRC